ncbi:hypothetical protein [Pseudomonas wenzhouensis]|uniref:hypothetical protein n=1 Tax=Pseudomonas wenzhouensis TaxID=2906062 RepID=UPI001E52E6B2|nr:hypothetical protein [Pseudomonas wenzhouensis]
MIAERAEPGLGAGLAAYERMSMGGQNHITSWHLIDRDPATRPAGRNAEHKRSPLQAVRVCARLRFGGDNLRNLYAQR